MSDKIGKELADRLERIDPAADVAVIVSLRPGTDPGVAADRGLAIASTYESIAAVAGTLRADRVEALARLDEVERIDLDGEVRALD